MKKQLFPIRLLSLLLLITVSSVGCDRLLSKQATFPQSGSYASSTLPDNIPHIKGTGKIGSGVIVAKEDDTYYVLTAKHVVNIIPGRIEDPYTLYFPNGDEYKLTYDSDIIIDPNSNLDLALVKFKSNQNYPIATLNKNISRQQSLTVSGWKSCVNQPRFESTTGEVEVVLSPSNSSAGHTLNYSNPTIEGMSGGAVLNENNELVGIHAAAKQFVQYDKETCAKLDELHGDNLGVPIESFVQSDLFDQLPKGSYTISNDSSFSSPSPSTKSESKKPDSKKPSGLFLRPDKHKDL